MTSASEPRLGRESVASSALTPSLSLSQSPSEPREAPDSQRQELASLFEPVLYALDDQVQRVTVSQTELRLQLDSLLTTLRDIRAKAQQDPLVPLLEEKSKKLVSLKRRITLVHTILQNCNERCRKLISVYKISESK